MVGKKDSINVLITGKLLKKLNKKAERKGYDPRAYARILLERALK